MYTASWAPISVWVKKTCFQFDVIVGVCFELLHKLTPPLSFLFLCILHKHRDPKWTGCPCLQANSSSHVVVCIYSDLSWFSFQIHLTMFQVWTECIYICFKVQIQLGQKFLKVYFTIFVCFWMKIRTNILVYNCCRCKIIIVFFQRWKNHGDSRRRDKIIIALIKSREGSALLLWNLYNQTYIWIQSVTNLTFPLYI